MSRLPLTSHILGNNFDTDDSPNWIFELDNPYLHGAYAPTLNTNVSATELHIDGELPEDLCGAYFRNGPNPLNKPSNRYHPFDGDGMVHAVYFQNGEARYCNRMIQTKALKAEQQAQKSLWPGVMGPFDFSLPDFPIKDTANTDLVLHNGQLISLWYNSGHPYAMAPDTLQNLGPYELPSKLTRKISAHSKVDWSTGELFFFDYGDEPPFMIYGVLDANGNLKHEAAIDLPGPRLPHELAFTQNYAILHDHPLFHDLDVLQKHHMRVVQFHDHIPTRFGVIPRLGSSVRWFECDPCYVLHTSNAWEQGDWIIMDGCRSTNPIPSANTEEGELSHMLAYMRLEAHNYRWQFNLKTGEVRESAIDDLNTEFNISNPIFHGVKTRYAYHQLIPTMEQGSATLRFDALIKYDNDSGCYQQWDYGDGVYGSEVAFAPKMGADRNSAEDEGYLINIVVDAKNWQSHCLVFDAKDISRGPITRMRLPCRVPVGFHAHWGKAEDVFPN